MRLIKLVARYHVQDIYINPEHISNLTTSYNKTTEEIEHWVAMKNSDNFSVTKNCYDELISEYLK